MPLFYSARLDSTPHGSEAFPLYVPGPSRYSFNHFLNDDLICDYRQTFPGVAGVAVLETDVNVRSPAVNVGGCCRLLPWGPRRLQALTGGQTPSSLLQQPPPAVPDVVWEETTSADPSHSGSKVLGSHDPGCKNRSFCLRKRKLWHLTFQRSKELWFKATRFITGKLLCMTTFFYIMIVDFNHC